MLATIGAAGVILEVGFDGLGLAGAGPRELQQQFSVNFGKPSGISGPEAEERNRAHEKNWALSRQTEEEGWTDSPHTYEVPQFNNEPYREDLQYWSKTKQPTPIWVDLPGPLAEPAPGQPADDGVPKSGSSEIRWGAPVARKMPESLLEQLRRMENLREQVRVANAQSQQLLEAVRPHTLQLFRKNARVGPSPEEEARTLAARVQRAPFRNPQARDSAGCLSKGAGIMDLCRERTASRNLTVGCGSRSWRRLRGSSGRSRVWWTTRCRRCGRMC